ncbi:type I-F CRISPR-associated endonuclease Cas1f [candidate division CSSED10-310 bacterium]|uniref:CRISPR-associated endonuclease Cas1 n=1 Tax=candidate division CSSED10-310 bacterium TaxID=2855610 RepID=A0ABV6YZT7_UNCC1
MKQLTDLKAILHSKRANIFYLEYCRVMQKDGRVVYLTVGNKQKQYWNIPIANTTVILLGTGTSITQAAIRMLATAGVLVGFSGGGGTPLLAANEIEWLSPQSEYRPTEYVQGWLSFWFDEKKRFEVAKHFQHQRLDYLQKVWEKDTDLQAECFYLDDHDVQSSLARFIQQIEQCQNISELLTTEAQLTKALYKIAASRTGGRDFTRQHESIDGANAFLNHGNYLTYGLAATTLWVLGIPHGFAVMHGKTRRGALVFDVADLIKDALILPWAFICEKEGATEQEFRQQCLKNFIKYKSLDFMFATVKETSLRGDQL